MRSEDAYWGEDPMTVRNLVMQDIGGGRITSVEVSDFGELIGLIVEKNGRRYAIRAPRGMVVKNLSRREKP